jgi:hypothetical protein
MRHPTFRVCDGKKRYSSLSAACASTIPRAAREPDHDLGGEADNLHSTHSKCAIEMGFGDEKVMRNTHAGVSDMRSPDKWRGCDLDDRTSGEEGFRSREEIDDAGALAMPF